MAELVKMQQLKVYLLKETVGDLSEAVKEDEHFVSHDIVGAPFQGILLTKPSHPSTPDWVGFLSEGLSPKDAASLAGIKTSSAYALLLLDAGPRKFALTWGYGRTFLRPSAYVRDFGLRVVLNTVDPESVRSVDMHTVEEMTFLTRRQASRASDFSNFRLDESQDLLRGVTGEPRNEAFAKRIAGAESVTLAARVSFDTLAAKCLELFAAYGEERYRERFAFIDNLSIVNDPDEIAALESRLIEDLKAGNIDQMHLAPAEPEDWENISCFTYSSSAKANEYRDLDVGEALAELKTDLLSTDYLKGRYIYVRYREQDAKYAKYNLHSCLVYETEVDDRLYVLSGGDWHEVQRDWAQGIREQVESIPAYTVALPPADANETEGEYNKRAALALACPMLDKDLIQLAPPYDKVELCDLLVNGNQFVHVKRKTESATLSHLFNQGLVSAELFAHEPEFREKAKEKIRPHDAAVADALPSQERPGYQQYEVVYAVIAKPNPRWPRSLPFFSQLTLANTAKRLGQLGYGVSLKLVEVAAP